MVAKMGLMITHLGGTQEKLALKGLEFKRDPDIPALNLLPETENGIPSAVQDQNNRLNLKENEKRLAYTDI
jgi:hypothetical protein